MIYYLKTSELKTVINDRNKVVNKLFDYIE